MSPTAGTEIAGAYRLLAPLGAGGFAEVWRALVLRDGTEVAIKFLKLPGPDAFRRFEIELEALRRIAHEGSARPIDHGESPFGPYIVTELFEGEDPLEWRRRAPDVGQVCAVIADIADILAAAHREGIVHRDLKPSNVLIRQVAGSPVVSVLDFGIAKLLDDDGTDLTKTGELLGTVGFMSPEQLLGQRDVGPATDMYALGVLFYELLEGRPPFAADSAVGMSAQHLREHPQPLTRKVSGEVSALVMGLLDKDPGRRPSATAVVRALSPSRPDGHARGDERPTPSVSASRRRWLWSALVLGLLAGAGIAAVVLARDPTSPREPTVAPPNPVAPPPPRVPAAARTPVAPERVAQPDEGGGCPGMPSLRPGVRRLGALADGSLVYIPRGYSPARRYPVLVLFHDAFQDRTSVLSNIDFDTPGADDYVYLAPDGDPLAMSDHWRSADVLDRARFEILDLAHTLCIDDTQLFALGHGYGGRAAEALGCSGTPFRAIATFAYRLARREKGCALSNTLPRLAIFPMEDDFARADGSRGCAPGKNLPVQKHIERMRDAQKCSGEPEPRSEGCVEHSCAAPTITCEVPGGRIWRHPASNIGLTAARQRGCEVSGPTAFPVLTEVLSFFREVRAVE